MKKSVYVFAILAAAISSSAMAKDVKQDKKAAPAAQMSDTEMDKVTAGGLGLATACCESPNVYDHLKSDLGPREVSPGFGRNTAPGRFFPKL